MNEEAAIPIGLAALTLLFALIFAARKTHKPAEAAQPDLEKGRLLVSGWSFSELQRVLTDFESLYELNPSSIALRRDDGEWLEVSWPNAISSDHALFLVNYIHYPMDFELNGRSICAVGVWDLTEGAGPEDIPIGTPVKYYVPTDNTAYDEVFAMLEDRRSFQIPFTNFKWRPIDNPRASARVISVPFDIGDK